MGKRKMDSDIAVWFAGPENGHAKAVAKAIKSLRHDAGLYLKDIGWNKKWEFPSSSGQNYCIIEVAITTGGLADCSEEKRDELESAILTRLAINMAILGYLPLDENGDIVYLLDEYGFSAIFAAMEKGRADSLENVVLKAVHEV